MRKVVVPPGGEEEGGGDKRQFDSRGDLPIITSDAMVLRTERNN